ncbi:FRG domain-containing protein [Leptospira ognonensis]|uniref:FRG domain-containing protein n=1 Tax=Leptospira ognonensis TaxID=2484945 RepID=UPI0014385B91|nr:FRG domain-containing protein [Leptospira ognonensis]
MNQFELERYTTHYPFLKNQLSNIFSIGAYRANRILKDRENFEPIEIQVNTRKEIEDIIDQIKNKISKTKYELWYRGQDKEYFVKNIHKDVLSLCPWRSIRDVSLIPSIFRTASNLPKSLDKYTTQLFQILKNETLLRLHLSIPAYKNLLSDEKAEKEFFKNKAWSKDNQGFETVHLTNENEIKEKRYFNPILYSIQNALILQHYTIPSNILDITKSLDVALFFAQNELSNSKYIQKENIKESVIYLFIFNPDTDRFIDSTLILNGQKIIRPIRQSCGVISGASISNQNYYARFISLRIKLLNHINYDKNINENFLFPSSLEDPIRNFLEKIK